MRKLFFLVLALAFVVPSFGQTALRLGNDAPEFTASAMDGRSYDLNSMRGRVVVLTFWSTKCEICRHEIPKLNTFAARFDESKVVFLAATLENEEKVGSYLKANPFKFHILPNSFAMILKYADRDKQGNLDMGFPAYFVIDQAGTVAYRGSGWDKTVELDLRLTKLLAAK
jgi:peroxiredoxin